MDDRPPASIALESLGIPHRVFQHDGPVESLEQAARERNERPEQVIRSILFRLGEDQYAMVLVAGPAQISWKKLRKHMGQSRLTMATEDEVRQVTGYRVGAVSPFGAPGKLRMLVDPGVTTEDEVSLGSGVRGVAIIMRTADLLRALGQLELVELVGEG